MTLVLLYSPRSPLGDSHTIEDSTSPTGPVSEDDDDIGYESKVVAFPGSHDGFWFALGVCNDQGGGGETWHPLVTFLEKSIDPNR